MAEQEPEDANPQQVIGRPRDRRELEVRVCCRRDRGLRPGRAATGGGTGRRNLRPTTEGGAIRETVAYGARGVGCGRCGEPIAEQFTRVGSVDAGLDAKAVTGAGEALRHPLLGAAGEAAMREGA